MENEINICQVCKHHRSVHFDENDGYIVIKEYGNHWCEDCLMSHIPADRHFHTFKFDNLDYIEQEAKRRGLI